MLDFIRRNIGVFVSFLCFCLLIILTFGNIDDVFTTAYWKNVYENLASIGILSVSLAFIQTAIKQGISEQALSHGLNQPDTQKKFIEHKAAMKQCEEKLLFIPYFLDMRNQRETVRRKKDFLINNRFSSEKKLLMSGKKRLIKKYNSIITNIRLKDIKWSSTEITIDKYGRIETLPQYRRKRLFKGIVTTIVSMALAMLVARELFGKVDGTEFWVKVVRLLTYVITIAVTVIMSVLRNYEKGKFGVPVDLDEINVIWEEFYRWDIPKAVLSDVERCNNMEGINLIKIWEAGEENEEEENAANSGTALQEKSKEVQKAKEACASC